LSHKLHSQNALVQFSLIGSFLGPSSASNIGELDKGVVLLHVDTNDFSKGRKEHLKVFTLGGSFLEVHNEERITGRDVSATFIFFTSDPTIPTSKFCTETIRNSLNPPV
jgi:hypothetical protein